ncbi:hypothetical protein HGRIS_003327 [Hohenbuehelia grisea]|uniref:Uncharacterized protein n=1 Tax=Hohenbuehelia grisea TaxID=104357 RepID=A0ABR3JF27_9AGAR
MSYRVEFVHQTHQPDLSNQNHILPLPTNIPLSISGIVDSTTQIISQPVPQPVEVPSWVSDSLQQLMAEINDWKLQYKLIDIDSMVVLANEYLKVLNSGKYFETATVDDFFRSHINPTSEIMARLDTAFSSSATFYRRLESIMPGIPTDRLLDFNHSLRLIQRDRKVVRVALERIIAPFHSWMMQLSPFLTKVLKSVTDATPSAYSSGLLKSKSVRLLAPKQWLDDNLINYCLGNHEGREVILIKGYDNLILCSTSLWSRISHCLQKYDKSVSPFSAGEKKNWPSWHRGMGLSWPPMG